MCRCACAFACAHVRVWRACLAGPGAPDCAFYVKTGTCKYGATCKFNHPPAAQPELHPQRPGAPDCSFYMKTGFLIEDGKLTAPIKDVNIIGNGPEALSRIDMVGNDLKVDDGGWTCGKNGQSVPVSQGMPTVRVSSLVVGGEQ